MRNISDAMAQLAALGRTAAHEGRPGGGRLQPLTEFGSNPGALKAQLYVPPSLAQNAALVVVLHGCTQTAAGYDIGSGWSDMADRHGFAVLFPEQQRQNNANLCFNWFAPDDYRRGSGEALSIRQMIAAVNDTYGIDPERVFVTGLSAGGAMAAVMLATYPEVFAGGAIVAGLPYGCASTVPQAFDRMRGAGGASEVELANLVRSASDHAGPWPIISIWHGSGDATVNPNNAEAMVAQWRGLHGAGVKPTRTEVVDGYPRRVWCNSEGREVIEDFSITGMGHGTPLDTAAEGGCGKCGPYMLEASISSTHHICRFWGLLDESDGMERGHETARQPSPRELIPVSLLPGATDAPPLRFEGRRPAAEDNIGTAGVGKVIEDALRAAGLMR